MIQNIDEKWHEKRSFQIGYGKFPYIIVKAEQALYIQIPIHFNANGDFDNYPGTHVDWTPENEIADYKKDITSKLHETLIAHCTIIKNKMEADYQKPCTICLVERPETAYYFDKEDIRFNSSIPSGGTLITQQYKILAMNVEHYLL